MMRNYESDETAQLLKMSVEHTDRNGIEVHVIMGDATNEDAVTARRN